MTRKRKNKPVRGRKSRERRLYPFNAGTTLFSVLSPKGYKPYFKLMDTLHEFLLNAPLTRQDAMYVTRLMFRPLRHGEKKQLYMALSVFCKSHPFASRRWSMMTFSRWLSAPEHSNLGTSAWTIARLINMY